MRRAARVLVVAACLSSSAAAAAVVDEGSAMLEVEIGAKSFSVHHGSNARHHPVARREREADGLSQLEQQEVAASQDGAFPYFVGSWNGFRNNWYGDVGIAFVPQRDFHITSLGRHHHNVTGLKQTAPVTLWSVETQMPLAIVNIGPDSTLEGHYHWAPVDEPGVQVKQGREYRLTQACTPNMADTWFDQTLSFEDVEANTATGHARFIGAVNLSGFGYPVNVNGQFRRAGMVNFKMRPPVHHIAGGVGSGSDSGARHECETHRAIAVVAFLFVMLRVA